MSVTNYLKNIHVNIRFYILAAAVISSLTIASWLQLTIASDQLFYIRLQQIYGLASVILLYIAVLLTPLSKVLSPSTWLSVLLFSRRAFGVSAAYFALLHTIVAVTDQIGGLANLALLPERFKVAFVLGGVALVILLLMAGTSFDAVIKKMTFKWWKRLHSYVYLAGVLIIVHIWLIGTHSDITNIRVLGAALLGILFALEANRLVQKYSKRPKLSKLKKIVAGLAIFGVLFGSLWLLPLLAGNYHSDHDEASEVTASQQKGTYEA